MKTVRARNGCDKLKGLAAVVICLAVASPALADLMITSATSVRAGVTSIDYYRTENSVGVNFVVIDPTGTNVTKFIIQRSPDLNAWTDWSATLTVTGSSAGQIGDFTTPTDQFYRLRLINFQ